MLIAYESLVDTAVDRPKADPDDAAHVGDGVRILRCDKVDADDVPDIQGLNVKGLVTDLDVDLSVIGAAADRPVAVSGDTAGKMLSVYAAIGSAVADDAQVFTSDAADGDQTLHRSGEAAAGNAAPVGADNAADTAAAPVRHNDAGHVQIQDPSILFKITKQALV